jgi:hypothetical protein
LTFSSLKNDVNVPSKSNMQENFFKNLFFVGILKVNDENRRIRIHWSEAWIRGSASGSRSTPKCHGSATLLKRYLFTTGENNWTCAVKSEADIACAVL